MAILDNPLYNVDKDKTPSDIEYTAVADDQEELIDGESEPRKQFQRQYARCWPFGMLKTVNLFLLLAITALAIVNASVPSEFLLDWSDCWKGVAGILRSDYPYAPKRLACACGVLLAMATFSWIAHLKRSSLPSLALLDLCIRLMTVANLAVIAVAFAVRVFAEFTWFWPKLHDESMTLAELTEWGKVKDEFPYFGRRYYGGKFHEITTPGTPTDRDIEKMELRKLMIQARLMFDPSMVALAMLAILLQAVFLWRTVSALKRSKLWASNYAKAHPGCSALALAYARFWPIGLFKFAHVFIPLVMFNVSLYACFNPRQLRAPIVLGLLSIPFLLKWLSYVQKVRFHGQRASTIEQFCKKDCKFTVFAMLVYGFLYMMVFSGRYGEGFILIVIMLATGLLAVSLVLNLRLLHRHGDGGGFKLLNWPSISVNVSVKVVKKGEETNEEGKVKKNEEQCQ